MSFETKLEQLRQIKQDIKDAITEKGVSVGDDMTLYANKIRNIPTITSGETIRAVLNPHNEKFATQYNKVLLNPASYYQKGFVDETFYLNSSSYNYGCFGPCFEDCYLYKSGATSGQMLRYTNESGDRTNISQSGYTYFFKLFPIKSYIMCATSLKTYGSDMCVGIKNDTLSTKIEYNQIQNLFSIEGISTSYYYKNFNSNFNTHYPIHLWDKENNMLYYTSDYYNSNIYITKLSTITGESETFKKSFSNGMSVLGLYSEDYDTFYILAQNMNNRYVYSYKWVLSTNTLETISSFIIEPYFSNSPSNYAKVCCFNRPIIDSSTGEKTTYTIMKVYYNSTHYLYVYKFQNGDWVYDEANTEYLRNIALSSNGTYYTNYGILYIGTKYAFRLVNGLFEQFEHPLIQYLPESATEYISFINDSEGKAFLSYKITENGSTNRYYKVYMMEEKSFQNYDYVLYSSDKVNYWDESLMGFATGVIGTDENNIKYAEVVTITNGTEL